MPHRHVVHSLWRDGQGRALGFQDLTVACHTDNQEAYDCFLRGCELWWRHSKEANRDAQPLLRRAIELDPRFAPAYAFLAGALVNDYVNGWTPSPAEALEEGEKTARRAAEIDERSPIALWTVALSCIWARRYDEAVSAVEKTIAFNPSFAEGHNVHGVILHFLGRSEEALEHFERAVALEALSD